LVTLYTGSTGADIGVSLIIGPLFACNESKRPISLWDTGIRLHPNTLSTLNPPGYLSDCLSSPRRQPYFHLMRNMGRLSPTVIPHLTVINLEPASKFDSDC
jgi:hypothetical protein